MSSSHEYQSKIDFGKLPQVAGLCSLEEATKPGLAVDVCVERLKRIHYSFHRIWNIFVSRLTAEPIYELKMCFSHHSHLCAEKISAIRDRVAEMRHPPLGLEKIPDNHLEAFYDEILSAPETHQLIIGIYKCALPKLKDAAKLHLQETHPLADAPSRRILTSMISDIEDMVTCGNDMISAFNAHIINDFELKDWEGTLGCFLSCAGGILGNESKPEAPPERKFAKSDYNYDFSPKRDIRFDDPYNMGVHAEEFLYDPSFSAKSKTLMMYFKRLREIDVPEMMASIIAESKEKPWLFHQDMTRQLWDEARHAMMGEVGFHKLKIDWPKFIKINFTWSKELNEQLSARERHAVLWFIEQGLMSKTGKRYEWEVGKISGDALCELFQDFDWADEVLHARIGRDWYVTDFESVDKAARFGSQCWDKVVSDWEQWEKEKLTKHRNWWPELYLEFCKISQISPNQKELNFSKSYRDTRADLQRISASG